jgi:hypothetical protein
MYKIGVFKNQKTANLELMRWHVAAFFVVTG